MVPTFMTSPHRLSATMVTAPGATRERARAEVRSVFATMKEDHPEDYSKRADSQISAKLFRDQIAAGATTVLLVLLAASALISIIACSVLQTSCWRARFAPKASCGL